MSALADDGVARGTGLRKPDASAVVLLAILVVAALLRLRGLGWGLPALYDPDEPIFMLTALKLLREGTLNPGWFGHPGTTTIYALAVVYVAVAGLGLLTGRFAGTGDFARAIYADPGVMILPGRALIVVFGLLTIVLAFLLACRLFGTRAGLIAALLLAVDPIHVKYSQIIRTDMHETVFLLLCVLASVNVARRGAARDYAWAAVWLGLACATKWPAVVVAVSIAGAAAYRMAREPDERRLHAWRLATVGPLAVLTLFAASPFLLLDWHTVLANLSGEARTHHPGATGHGLWRNAWWYLSGPFTDAVGPLGVVLVPVGLVVGARRTPAFAVTVVPLLLVSLVAISAQALVWERWIVPLLPFAAVAIAAAIDAGMCALPALPGRIAGGVGVTALAVPALLAGEAAATERANDTRALASAWARAHVPKGATVIVEQLAFDLLGTGWRFLYPVGDAGCVDVAANLRARIPYATVERWRGGRPVIDVGTIAPKTFGTCRADWAILAHYDRYLLEPQTYAAEIRTYRALIAQGSVAATFRPVPGKVGGPVMRVVRLDPRSPGWDRPVP